MSKDNGYCVHYCRFPMMVENEKELQKVCESCPSKFMIKLTPSQDINEYDDELIASILLETSVTVFKRFFTGEEEKTAANAIQQFEQIANILFNVTEIPARREAMMKQAETVSDAITFFENVERRKHESL